MCPCGRASRKANRAERKKGLVPTYCKACIRAEDMRPVDYDMAQDALTLEWQESLGWRGRSGVQILAACERSKLSVVRGRLRELGRRMYENSVLHERAQDLLWSGTLTDEQHAIWSLFVVDGLSEKEISRRVGRSTDYIYERVLGPCREACGYPVRKYTPPKHRRGPNKRARNQE